MIEFLSQMPTDTMIFLAINSGFGGNTGSAEMADLGGVNSDTHQRWKRPDHDFNWSSTPV